VNNPKVSIRVYNRNDEGTILLWNKNSLTPEQSGKRKILVKTTEDGVEWEPETMAPDSAQLSKVLADGNTDAIIIKHSPEKNLIEAGSFWLRMIFGEADAKEASLFIEKKGEHTGYAKVIRYTMPNGRVVYAMPAVIVGDMRDQFKK
jgi:hypothetical protein